MSTATNTSKATEVATSFLDEFAGSGLETITQEAVSTGYLSMVQPGGQAVAAGHTPGSWRNSATDENYGEVVRVVPVAFKIIWAERDAQGMTVARYEPNSIPVNMEPVASGKKGYPKMINPATRNEVRELFVYAVVLPEHKDAGVLLFSPSVSSMRACKAWNSQLRGQLLPNGSPAPIFAYSWDLSLELIPNPMQPANKMAHLSRVQRDVLVDEGLFTGTIKPQLTAVTKTVLAITADDSLSEEA